jgi:hypothetical protein
VARVAGARGLKPGRSAAPRARLPRCSRSCSSPSS